MVQKTREKQKRGHITLLTLTLHCQSMMKSTPVVVGRGSMKFTGNVWVALCNQGAPVKRVVGQGRFVAGVSNILFNVFSISL